MREYVGPTWSLCGSGAAEIPTQKVISPWSVGLAQAQPPTKLKAIRKQPSAGLGPDTAHPSHSGVGPRITQQQQQQWRLGWYD